MVLRFGGTITNWNVHYFLMFHLIAMPMVTYIITMFIVVYWISVACGLDLVSSFDHKIRQFLCISAHAVPRRMAVV